MTKISIVITAVSLMSLALVPLVAADETQPDCEAQQGWIGYTTTRPFTGPIDTFLGDNAHLQVCEGEHWDGQDTVRPGDNPGHTPSCTAADVTSAPESFFIGNCQNADPNDGAPSTSGTPPTAVLGLRVSGATAADGGAVYVIADIYGVGKAGTYADACTGCGATADTLAGVYVEDNTNQIGLNNILATVVSSAGITRGYVDEGDCAQGDGQTPGTYQYGAETGDRQQCGRDNTAVSAELILP